MAPLIYRTYLRWNPEDRDALRQHRINWPQERRRGWLAFAWQYCVPPVAGVLAIVMGGLTVPIVVSSGKLGVPWGAILGMAVLWLVLTAISAALYARFLWRRQTQLLEYAIALDNQESERLDMQAQQQARGPDSTPLASDARVTLRLEPPA